MIWLIRHGETEWSLSGAHTGRTDIPLTPVGEEQAAGLKQRLAGKSFELVLSSPLGRAVRTCELAGCLERAEIEPDLAEWNYGADEGRTTAQIRAERPGWLVFRDGPRDGETLEQVAVRARRVLQRCLAAKGDAALFSHGHLLRILAACWLGLPPEAGRFLALGTASISALGFEHETPVLVRWNS